VEETLHAQRSLVLAVDEARAWSTACEGEGQARRPLAQRLARLEALLIEG
jgi:hypothetical protein